MRAGPYKRLSAEELMPSNCGAGKDSGGSLGQQGDQIIERIDAEAEALILGHLM